MIIIEKAKLWRLLIECDTIIETATLKAYSIRENTNKVICVHMRHPYRIS